MKKRYAVVDLFAGAGGLAEGFANARGDGRAQLFSIELSVEKEPPAHATLLLRAFLRQFGSKFPKEYYEFLNGGDVEPDWSTLYPEEWARALEEALCIELGSKAALHKMDSRIAEIRRKFKNDIVLVGGPPCQAYSVVGRVRNKGIAGYRATGDHRNFLYREYIRILETLKPAAFVMENVTGLLSSTVGGESMFQKVLADLRGVGTGGWSYRLMPLVQSENDGSVGREFHPKDFVIKAEDFGVPQSRHRVIIVGVRENCLHSKARRRPVASFLKPGRPQVSLKAVIDGMPRLRSGLSRSPDSGDAWRHAMEGVMKSTSMLKLNLSEAHSTEFREKALMYRARVGRSGLDLERSSPGSTAISSLCPRQLQDWLWDPRLTRLPNNETRGHMPSDLQRYFFSALFAKIEKRSPTASDYPAALSPDHSSWSTGDFADRFRVQLWDRPSTTITCHISKDGHYFIHPDPLQCRSLTVREAARLQTFPDNYFFKGNRTQQYVQVGNAVPPYLAKQIAEAVYALIS